MKADVPFIVSPELPRMGLPRPKTRFTVDEYLVLERAAEQRHFYFDGEIFSMAGESGEHGDITANIVIALGSQLKGKPCRARTKDTRVRSGPILQAGDSMRGMFSYPDVVVICGEPEYYDDNRDIVLNPTAIIEVLSPSTEDFDRGDKFTRYQTYNPTLKYNLLVAQDRPLIEQFTRQADGSWLPQSYSGLDVSVAITSIESILRLADVYYRVRFPDRGSTAS
jgi:Uma2 family endonuclease